MGDDRLRLLQALRLKGRLPAADLAGATGLDEHTVEKIAADLSADGLTEEARGRLKLTAAGREQLEDALAVERRNVNQHALATLYEEFDEYNAALKTLMTRWQLKSDETPNDHTDAAYDNAIVEDLGHLDERFQPLLSRMVATVPRLGHYPSRLGAALARVEGGDHSWFAKPLADSYHTVWFELHEDLIGLAGLSREAEAAAGRAE
jgi:DNA-binding MarR family transcriptional regulator